MQTLLRFLARLEGRVLVAVVLCTSVTTIALVYLFTQNAQPFISVFNLALSAYLVLKKGGAGKI